MLLYEGHGHATRGGNGYKHSDRKRLTDPVKLYFKNGVKIKLLAIKEELRNFANRLNYIGIKEVFREGRKCGKGLGTQVRKELALQAESPRTRAKECRVSWHLLSVPALGQQTGELLGVLSSQSYHVGEL